MNANQTPKALRAKSATALCAALFALGLAGCSYTTGVRYDKVYPITVANSAAMIEVPAEGALSAQDAARVVELGRNFLKSGEGELTIAYPKGQKSGKVVADATRRLIEAGVPTRQILRGPYDTALDGDRGVVVSYYGPVAVATECPANPMDPNLDTSNGAPLRFGCAYQHNVAAMLENPRDAVSARPSTPASADRRRHVLEKYVTGDLTTADSQEKTQTTE